jgi:hypothetical protein
LSLLGYGSRSLDLLRTLLYIAGTPVHVVARNGLGEHVVGFLPQEAYRTAFLMEFVSLFWLSCSKALLDDLENLVSQLGAQLCLTVLKKIFLPKNTNLIDVKIYI